MNEATTPKAPGSRARTLRCQSIGRPVAISGLARLLLKIHTRPVLQLVPIDDKPRRPVPALEQG